MSTGDGVRPSFENRASVLRRLLRRAARSIILLGVSEPCLPELLDVSYSTMVESYPELSLVWDEVSAVIGREEMTFRRTLVQGTKLFNL